MIKEPSLWRGAFAVLALSTVTACGGTDSPTNPPSGSSGPPASVAITGGTSVSVDGTLQLTGVVRDASGGTLSGQTIAWQVNEDSLATVSSTGLVTGLLPGAPVVSASVGGLSANHTVSVTPPTIQWAGNGLTGHFTTWVDDSSTRAQWGWGYSYYSAVWPLKPDMDEWTQLGWGTWMLANTYEDENGVFNKRPDDVCAPDARLPSTFQSNEGGVGSWGNILFPTPMPKFTLAATANCYSSGIGGPGYAPGGGDVLDSDDLYFAQLSNQVLLPPDRVNYSEPSEPALFGIGWIALPIVPENYSPYGIPTGGNSWTLFFNAANFAGPVGFFTPAFWTSLDAEGANSAGYGLDRRGLLASLWSLEVGFTASISASLDGVDYKRVPRMTFGTDENGRAVLTQEARYYEKSALWDAVEAWVGGGSPATSVSVGGTRVLPYEEDGGDAVKMMDKEGDVPVDFAGQIWSAAGTSAGGGSTFGLEWGEGATPGIIPEYYKKVDGAWRAIPASEVPRRTWLQDQSFSQMPVGSVTPLPTDTNSPWTSEKWAAGPFAASLPDGSTVDYVWYRFVDQPAISRLDLSAGDEDRLQAWVESVHTEAAFTIPPPSSGTLAEIAPGHLVSPPAGMEVGYVPIVIHQR